MENNYKICVPLKEFITLKTENKMDYILILLDLYIKPIILEAYADDTYNIESEQYVILYGNENEDIGNNYYIVNSNIELFYLRLTKTSSIKEQYSKLYYSILRQFEQLNEDELKLSKYYDEISNTICVFDINNNYIDCDVIFSNRDCFRFNMI
jgi:hypothetical protein